MSTGEAGRAFGIAWADELARSGVRHACLSPGSRSTPLALALAEQEDIALHVIIDERSAAFTALGIARATGAPAVVLCTSGTAAANLHPAIVEADRDRVPLLAITADRPPELRGAGANQTIDQLKLYGSAVRLFVEAGVPESLPASARYWRSLASQAYTAAVASPAGPVHINIAFREPFLPRGAERPPRTEGRQGGAPWTRLDEAPRVLTHAQVGALSAQISLIDRGLVLAGPGAPGNAVADLAEAAGWPLLAEPLSNARTGPTAISTYDALLRDGRFAATHRPSLVIRMGSLVLSSKLAALLTPDVTQIVIDADAAWLDPQRSAATILAADPAVACRSLIADLPARTDSRWLSSWREAEGRARSAVDQVLDAEQAPSEPRVARDLIATVPPGSKVVLASSMPVRDANSFMAPRGGIRFLGNRGASGIDGFVSTTLGIALGEPGPTFALAGDLSMLHDQNGLMLGHAGGISATFVVLNNDGGGIFSFLPQAALPDHFEELFGTPHGLSFERLAALYNCDYALLEHADDLATLVSAESGAPGVRIIEVRTDRAANVALHEKLWDAVARAVHPKRPPPPPA